MKNGIFEEKARGKCYYVNDQLHRLDGPAIESSDGLHSWWIFGQFFGSEIQDGSDKSKTTLYINGNVVKKEVFLAMVMEKALSMGLPEKEVTTSKKMKI